MNKAQLSKAKERAQRMEVKIVRYAAEVKRANSCLEGDNERARIIV